MTGGSHWTPGIGDPSFLGWLTVAAYLVAAVLCGAYALRRRSLDRPAGIRRHQVFWWAVAAVLLLLGINKQLDLQSWFTQVAKELAKNQGWYEERKIVQKVFIASIAALGIIGLSLTAWWVRRDWRQYGLALVGMACLVTFVVIRAASFHKVDLYLPRILNPLLELGSIVCVGVAAAIQLRRSRQPHRTDEREG